MAVGGGQRVSSQRGMRELGEAMAVLGGRGLGLVFPCAPNWEGARKGSTGRRRRRFSAESRACSDLDGRRNGGMGGLELTGAAAVSARPLPIAWLLPASVAK